MKIVAIIQARMGSSRLPGKVLELLDGRPMLEVLISRMRGVARIDQIVVATTYESQDELIVEWCGQHKIDVFRGDTNDVLRRYYCCAELYEADVVVRLTADDPLKDAGVVTRVIEEFISNRTRDYVSNTLVPSYPEGLDVEVFSISSLRRAHIDAILASDREHVTPYLWRNTELFKCHNILNVEDRSTIRLTVDYDVDLARIRQLIKISPNGANATMNELLMVIDQNQSLNFTNSGIVRNQGYIASLNVESAKECI